MSKRRRAQMQKREQVYTRQPWVTPVRDRAIALHRSGIPAPIAAWQALTELGPKPYDPENNPKHAPLTLTIARLTAAEIEGERHPEISDLHELMIRGDAIVARELEAMQAAGMD